MHIRDRIRLAWRVLRHKPGNLFSHAENELGKGFDIELQELLLVFSSQGHSGASAAITTALIEKLLRYQPISPLTGESAEWVDHGYCMQNKRCGAVFKQPDRFNGQAYYLDGIVWEDEEGHRYTNRESMVPIVFPYMPHTEYRPEVKEQA